MDARAAESQAVVRRPLAGCSALRAARAGFSSPGRSLGRIAVPAGSGAPCGRKRRGRPAGGSFFPAAGAGRGSVICQPAACAATGAAALPHGPGGGMPPWRPDCHRILIPGRGRRRSPRQAATTRGAIGGCPSPLNFPQVVLMGKFGAFRLLSYCLFVTSGYVQASNRPLIAPAPAWLGRLAASARARTCRLGRRRAARHAFHRPGAVAQRAAADVRMATRHLPRGRANQGVLVQAWNAPAG